MKRFVVALLLLSFAAPASAAEPPRAPLAESLTGPAKAAYDQAKSLFDAGDFANAIVKFKQSYELSNDPRLLWNMAVCEKNLRHYYRVQILLQRYLKEADAILTPENRKSVEETLAGIQSFVGVLKVTVDEPGASVLIDGEEVAKTPVTAPIPIDIGDHVVSVVKEGFFPVEQKVEVAGGSEVPLAVTLRARPQTAHLTIVAPGLITVDRASPARDRWEGPLPPGTHHIHVSASGKKPYDAPIELAPNANRTMTIALESEKSGALWPWIVGGATLVVAGAAVGGYFIFQPADETRPPVPGTLAPGTVTMR